MRDLGMIFALGIAMVLMPAFVQAQGHGYRLENVVILSRHGVRAPTKSTTLMQDVTPDLWPEWPVGLGDITPRGEHLITIMGVYYRQRFQQEKLLPALGCPADEAVYVWTDIDQRTRKTGEAFLAGLAPGCGLTIHYQHDLKQLDSLFHPVKSGKCAMHPDQVRLAVKKQAGVPLAQLDQMYASDLRQMSRVLDFPRSPFCQQQLAAGKACNLVQSLPDKLVVNDHGEEVTLNGALGLSSMLSGIFLLQQAQGMPEAAWGRIRSMEQWDALLKLHNVQFNLLARAPYIARHRGTPLLQTIAAALEPHARGKTFGKIMLPNSILFLGGHDTNIANISGMLGVSWILPGQPDDTPPGGALVFERWHDLTNNRQFVTVTMVYQTLQQLREQSPLSLKHPAGSMRLKLTDCEGEDAQGFCPLSSFMRLVHQRIEPSCALTDFRKPIKPASF